LSATGGSYDRDACIAFSEILSRVAMSERRFDTGLLGLGDGPRHGRGVVLAVSSFTGWYTGEGEGVTISVLGWNTGVLGKLVLFVGLAVVLVLVLRELGFEPPPPCRRASDDRARRARDDLRARPRDLGARRLLLREAAASVSGSAWPRPSPVIVAGLLQASEEM
jgi:hypothetical protein